MSTPHDAFGAPMSPAATTLQQPSQPNPLQSHVSTPEIQHVAAFRSESLMRKTQQSPFAPTAKGAAAGGHAGARTLQHSDTAPSMERFSRLASSNEDMGVIKEEDGA